VQRRKCHPPPRHRRKLARPAPPMTWQDWIRSRNGKSSQTGFSVMKQNRKTLWQVALLNRRKVN